MAGQLQTSSAVDVLAELAVHAPGRTAPDVAVRLLRELAAAGDFAAVRALARVIALEIGADDNTPGLRTSATLPEFVAASDVPALIRIYALGFRPAQLIRDGSGSELASDAQATDLAPLKALVERSAPIATEVLRAYVLTAFASMFGPEALIPAPEGVKLSIVDQIMNELTIVQGDAADATFEFGRDVILHAVSTQGLMFLLYHELTHHVTNAAFAGGLDTAALRVTDDVVGGLGAALPAMLDAAVAESGQPMQPGDPRGCRLQNGLSVLCSVENLPGGTYCHISLTDAGGPIVLEVGCALAFGILRLLGTDPGAAVAVQSPRGVFHFGVAGAPSSAAVAERAKTIDATQLPNEGQAWFSALQRAGRVGATEADVRYLLGVVERPGTIHGIAAEDGWRDQQIAAAIAGGAPLEGQSNDALVELLRVAVRSGNAAALARIVAATAEEARTADPQIAGLGASTLVISEADRTGYLGPDSDSLLAVVGALHRAGYGVDGIISENGDTLLTDAVSRNAALAAALLAVGGVDIERPDTAGRTPLAVAARRGDVATVTLLLEHGAQVTHADPQGRSALHEAAQRGDAEIVAALVARGADVEARTSDRDTPLMRARSSQAAAALCAAHADIGARNSSGSTALIAAAERGDVDVVTALLSAGADANDATDRGETALHFAARNAPRGRLDAITALLDAGADIDEETDDGVTPLMAAAMSVDPDVMGALIERGAQVDARTTSGGTALMMTSNGRLEWDRDPTVVDRMCACIDLLARAGSDVNLADDNGLTALHWASTGFSSQPVEKLLGCGADPRARARDGSTPLDRARAQDHQHMVDLLVAAGATDNQAPR